LHGWRAWREAMFAKLNGMFAFALWDARAQELVLARDRFGKKPLHYAVTNDGALAFGSESKSRHCAPGLDRSISNEAVEDFFTYGYVPDPKTIYRKVHKLPPAHFMVVKRGSDLNPRAYWSVLADFAGSRASREEALVEHLTAAVKRRLISDVPLGALLSGGVDFRAIVPLMGGLSPHAIQPLSL